MFLSGKTYEEAVYTTIWPQLAPQTGTEAISEKKLLENLNNMLPAAAPLVVVAPEYDGQNMKWCGPEEILILTSFFEDTVHLREYVPN
jgi:hypothetical protein